MLFFVRFKQQLTDYFYLRDDYLPSAQVEAWRISSLRIMLVSILLLCAVFVIQSAWQSVIEKVAYVIPMALTFYIALALLLLISRRYYRTSAYSLLALIILAGISFNATQHNQILSMIGPIVMYSTPFVAFMLLGWKVGIMCIALNTIPLYILINQISLADYVTPFPVQEHANYYVHVILFVFFNLCIPLAIARASTAAKRGNQFNIERNQVLSNQSQLYHALFVTAQTAKIIIDSNRNIIEANDSAQSLLLTSLPKHFIGLDIDKVFPELSNENSDLVVNRTLGAKMKVFELSVRTIDDKQHTIVTIQDVSAKALLHKTLAVQTQARQRLKLYDESIGLPNRQWLENKITTNGEHVNGTIALCAIRLNNGYFIEQKYGFLSLPKVLRKLADMLNEHFGERSFIAVLDKYSLGIAIPIIDDANTKTAINQLVATLPRNIQVNEHSIHLDCKAGVATYQQNVNASRLINNALHAVTVSELTINYYETGSQQRFIEHQEISILLSEALTHDELYVEYQPKVRGDGTLIGMEALLRWNSPVIGRVSPGVFIPIAEQSGLVLALTRWLINHVCAQLKLWELEGLAILPVAINISGPDLDQKDFKKYLINSVVEHDIKPYYLELELTESAKTQNIPDAIATVRYLASFGFCITLDDFGVGYSGLSKLTNFPVQRVKIDRQFITNIQSDAKNAKVVEAIVAMCKVFKIDVLAEGVEDLREVDCLLAMGCASFQGFAFARPMSKENIAKLMNNKLMPNVKLPLARHRV
ncbi:putative bifunctional diguanylate cyclase/phosphodiesterase [Paraglaciecola polaris]|uniref:Diguanylate cyclase/phosphodiesterase n=1 Tax=Paraglaciecola polaris LMG 21857 TaxID=1129793 RepID=K6YF30_9ALTE|nr:bifunctional diguanylate cyclase/phosphodiesterase [Paraglaciecola polaris]GAC31324.1 diguanylate cyclase/phosphodiesterase [Paraglaciecola polaris LMG 21857]